MSPTQRTRMSEADSEPWNQWAHELIDQRIRANNDMLVEEIGALIGEQARERDADIKALRQEIGQLRAEVSVLTGVGRGGATPLRGRDAA